MHHVGHRGYDKVPGVPAKYTSKVFAQGTRRFLDWPDWMRPDAWIYEHNVLHHFHTGEERDPDLIERNTEFIRNSGWPMPLRYGLMALLAATWRASYYAPNTLREFRARHRDESQPRTEADDRADLRALWTECYLPYATLHFALLPALFLPLAGPWGAFSAFVNSLGAEVLTNLHTFLVVGPNHSGDDLYRFDDRPRGKGEFFVRQVIGSVNYATGGDVRDYAHLWLNYQIEHHLWPDIPMSQYQCVQPKVRALCEKYGIPYVEQSVWTRARKMLDIAVGRTSMKRPPNRDVSESRVRGGASRDAFVDAAHDEPVPTETM
jgi:fatty acid desaturase